MPDLDDNILTRKKEKQKMETYEIIASLLTFALTYLVLFKEFRDEKA